MSEGVFKNPFDVIDDEEETGDYNVVVSEGNVSTTGTLIEKSLPAEIEQAFKKIVKKGSMTRSKGFAELLKYCQNESIEEFSDLLKIPFVKIFTKFAICSEKSSRLSVAELTNIFITKFDLKKFLQPVLKEILTIWLLTLFDPIGEISGLQRKNLEIVFPAGTKLKILLEKYENEILKEIWELSDKFERIREICLVEMEGTSEEADGVVELVKTEIIGLINLMLTSILKQNKDLKEILFLNDKFSSSRRLALYRLEGKMKSFPWYEKLINNLLLKETSPSAFPAALEIFENISSCSYVKVIKSESFTLNVLAYAPIPEFKKFGQFLLKFQVKESIDWSINICTSQANNLMNKDRFLSFWKDIACFIFNGFGIDSKMRALNLLLFKTSSICSFALLNSDETMQCVEDAFNKEEITSACLGKIHPQSIYSLSRINCENLDDLIMKFNLIDLQNAELMKVVPENLLVKRFSVTVELLSVPETVKLIQNINPSSAVEILKQRNFSEWEKILKSTLLKRETICKIFFELETFREYARENLINNSVVLSCAFQSKISVFDDELNYDDDHLLNLFIETDNFEIESPLLKKCLQNNLHFAGLSKLKNISSQNKKKLFEYLELKSEPELFDAMNCEDEEFYPIEFIEEVLNEAGTTLSLSLIEMIMYKSKLERPVLLEKLMKFPLKKFENQRKVVKCAFFYDLIDCLNFKITEKDFNDCEADNLELFCLSKVLEKSGYIGNNDGISLSTFKNALLFSNWCNAVEDPKEINTLLSRFIFDEASDSGRHNDFYNLGLIISFGTIPIRSDNLSGLIYSLQNDVVLLLLMISAHLERETLKKEFWQVQYREKLKSLLTYNQSEDPLLCELKLRVASGIWNKLTDPEIEILKDSNFDQVLVPESFESNNIDNNVIFENIGLARLVLMAAPFLEHFELNNLKELLSVDACSPAMLLAFRGVYLQLHLDEQLVASSYKLNQNLEQTIIDDVGNVIFPFYEVLISTNNSRKFIVLLEMFVSAAEGSREDVRLLSLFGDVLNPGYLLN